MEPFNSYPTIVQILIALGGGVALILAIATVVIYFLSLKEWISEKRYNYKWKHRFDKPPMAKCYCNDCKFHGGEYVNSCTNPGMNNILMTSESFCSEAEPITYEEAKKAKTSKRQQNEWRKTDFHAGDVVQTIDGLDRGLVTDVNENNMPTKVMSSPGRPSYIETRYYGGVESIGWYKTGESMTTKEWYELYSTKEGWQRYCEDRQNQIKLDG